MKTLKAMGFVIDESRGVGSHAVVAHPDDPSRVSVIPRRDPLPTGTMKAIPKGLRIHQIDFEREIGR